MRADSRRQLEAINEAIVEIGRFTANRTAADFGADAMLRSAVLCQLVRICESVRWLARSNIETTAQITQYRDIIGFRTRLIHRFHQVKLDLVWQYVQTDLPTPHEDVGALLAAADA